MSYGTPGFAGVSAKVAPSAATTRSQLMTSSQAPPQTLPSTIARTGVDVSLIARTACRSGS